MVVARQRPATAKGVVFMLLEDESGVANVIVPPPVYERCRLVVRTASFALVAGRLERREGVINVVADVGRAARGARPRRPPRSATSSRRPDRETGRDPAAEPTRELGGRSRRRAHSFGRR